MIPTVLIVAFVAALCVPRRWLWFLIVVLAGGAAWAAVIVYGGHASDGAAAFGLGAGNAAFATGLAFGIRALAAWARRRAAS